VGSAPTDSWGGSTEEKKIAGEMVTCHRNKRKKREGRLAVTIWRRSKTSRTANIKLQNGPLPLPGSTPIRNLKPIRRESGKKRATVVPIEVRKEESRRQKYI